MVKHVQGWDIIKRIGNKRKVYMRQFSGSKIDCMKYYMKPCIREKNPDHLIFHVGTNDVPSNKKVKCMAKSTVPSTKEVNLMSAFPVLSFVMITGTTDNGGK